MTRQILNKTDFMCKICFIIKNEENFFDSITKSIEKNFPGIQIILNYKIIENNNLAAVIISVAFIFEALDIKKLLEKNGIICYFIK